MPLKINWRSRSNSLSKSKEKDAKYISAAIIPSAAFVVNPTTSLDNENFSNHQNNLLSSTLNSSVLGLSQENLNKNDLNESIKKRPIKKNKEKLKTNSQEIENKNVYDDLSIKNIKKLKKKSTNNDKMKIDNENIKDSKRHIEIANGLSIESTPIIPPRNRQKEFINNEDNEIPFIDSDRNIINEKHSRSKKRSKSPKTLEGTQDYYFTTNTAFDNENDRYFQSSGNLKNDLYKKDNVLSQELIVQEIASNISEDDRVHNNTNITQIGFENIENQFIDSNFQKIPNIPIGFEESLSEKNSSPNNNHITTISSEGNSQSVFTPKPYFEQNLSSRITFHQDNPSEIEHKNDVNNNNKQNPQNNNKQVREEIHLLQDTIYRLNMELSSSLSNQEPGKSIGTTVFPGKGPVPSWLMNTKYLAPLFVANDQKYQNQTKQIQKMQIEIKNFETEILQIVKENERLHLKLQENQKGGQASNRSDWQVIIQQAKLVIEENHLLLEELDLQQQKNQLVEHSSTSEITQLKKSLFTVNSERDALDEEIRNLTHKLAGLKSALPLYSSNNNYEEGVSSMNDSVLSNQLKFFESQIEELKKDKVKLEDEVNTLKQTEKKHEKKLANYKQIIESEKQFRNFFNDVLEKSDEMINDRNTLIEAMEKLNNEIARIEKKLTIEINCRTNIDINEYENKPYKKSSGDSVMDQIYSIEMWMDILLQNNVDLMSRCDNQEKDVHKYQTLLKEKDIYLQECQRENDEMENKLEKLLKNATSEY